jgi:tyrosyl-tRNA synthetase
MQRNNSILFRGIEKIVTEEELVARLNKAEKTGIPLRIKVGFDPTSPDLHLGHFVLLKKLRQFQDLGHKVILIVGDFTGRIGDPTGRSETRPPLSEEEVQKNAQTYTSQVFKVLKEEQTEVVYNSTWLKKISGEEFIRLTSRMTLARMLEREDFMTRYKQGVGIHLHEFIYPLLQGYDSVAVKSDVEVGGSDQLFNLLVGRDLQRFYGQEEQVVITVPLLIGIDGVKKMSKTYNNTIQILDPPEEQFGKIMSIPDSLLLHYYELLTDVDINPIRSGLENGSLHPMELKEDLAKRIVTYFYGETLALKAKEHFHRVVREKKPPEDIEEFVISEEGSRWIPRLLKEAGMVPSTREALRLIREGAIEVNGKVIQEPEELKEEGDYLFRIGKRRFLRVRVERRPPPG